MKKFSFPKKLKGFFLAFLIVALAFLAAGLGTLGSFYSAGSAYELEKVQESGDAAPNVVFEISNPEGVTGLVLCDVYVNVAVIYADAGTSAELQLTRKMRSSTSFTYTPVKGVIENYFTPEEVIGEDGKPVETFPEPTATDAFYRYVAPFELPEAGWSVSSYPHIRLTATSAGVLLNEVVFIGKKSSPKKGEEDLRYVLNAEIYSATYHLEEGSEVGKQRAAALLDAQPSSPPELGRATSYDRFTLEEVASLQTISEMKQGNYYAASDSEGNDPVDTYHVDTVYGAFGNDILALGTLIFGMSPFGLRFFPMLAAFGALVVLSRFVARLARSEKAGFAFALLYACCNLTLGLGHLGTPLMLGVFFFACALSLVHRFYASGIRKANLLSALPLLAAGLFGAAAIAVNGAFVILTAGLVALFALGMYRQQKAKQYHLEKIAEEPAPAPMPVPDAVSASVAEGGEEPPLTPEQRAGKTVAEYRFRNLAAPLLFFSGLIVGIFLFVLIGMLPAYYAYLRFYDNPASPSMNVFALAWKTFANGFVGANPSVAGSSWSFFYKLFEGEGTAYAVTGLTVNWIAILAALAGVVYCVVRLVLLLTKKADEKTVRVALRRTLIPLVLLCLSLITAACVKYAVGFILLAWLFAFVLAANIFGDSFEGKTAKAVNIAGIAGIVLLVAVFALLFVFTVSIPLPATLVGKIF